MNEPLLRQVQEAITANPERFDMDEFAYDDQDDFCGTVFCIAGWAVEIADPCAIMAAKFEDGDDYNGDAIMVRAEELLEIDEDQARRLFIRPHWPEAFGKTGIDNNPVLACARIDHFIATGGAE